MYIGKIGAKYYIFGLLLLYFVVAGYAFSLDLVNLKLTLIQNHSKKRRIRIHITAFDRLSCRALALVCIAYVDICIFLPLKLIVFIDL